MIKIQIDSIKDNIRGIFVLKLLIPSGSRHDPMDKKGIHNIYRSLILRGCGPYNNQDLSDIVESYGAILNSEIYEDNIIITLKCAEKDKYKLIPIIAWMIEKPHFSNDQVELVKNLAIDSIKKLKEGNSHASFSTWRNAVYGTGPYGHDPLGSITDIKKINVEDVIDIMNKIIKRNLL